MNPPSSPASRKIPFEEIEIESSVSARFERVMALSPDHLAVRSRQNELSYASLNQAANRLGRAAIACCGEKAGPVALLLGHDIPLVTAILGVLKAGKFYNALSPSDPPARLTAILEDLQARLLITDNQYAALAAQVAPPRCHLLRVDEISPNLCDDNLDLEISSETMAVVFYTSGSTGTPKGVPREHRHILQRAWVEAPTVGPEDRFTMLRPFSFAASVTELFGSLMNGASLHIYDLNAAGTAGMADWLEQERITVVGAPITLVRSFLDTLEESRIFSTVRLVKLGGDVLYRRDVKRLRRHLSQDCILEYSYVASEAGLIAKMVIGSQMEITSPVVPVGYAIPGRQILILDESGQLLLPNQVGEIAVKSRFLTKGYLNQPSLTEEKFIPDPGEPTQRIYLTGDLGRLREDGCLEFLGRKDFMVKVRGFRVELGAVESALLDLPGVRSAVVTARSDAGGEKYLAAYIVSACQLPPQVGELRRALAQTLPDYMLPSAWVFLDALPLTTSGKVDRKALPEPGRDRAATQTPYAAPQTAEEEFLAGIWAQVLGLEQVGVNDNFFELGGNSLVAMRLLGRIQDVFQVTLPVRSIFESPTISGLAQTIANMGGSVGEWGQAPPLPPLVRQPRKKKPL